MIDILLDSEGDIDLTGGDMAHADTYRATEQHKRDILLCSPGDLKEYPIVGVGLVDYLNIDDNGLLLRNISQQMQRDGIRVNRVAFEPGGELTMDGKYENSNSSR